jgi:hypothetical protein
MSENEQQKKPDLETEETYRADFNQLMRLAGAGDKEAFKKMLKERWAKMRQEQ